MLSVKDVNFHFSREHNLNSLIEAQLADCLYKYMFALGSFGFVQSQPLGRRRAKVTFPPSGLKNGALEDCARWHQEADTIV